jgi:mono/diheme cytochrome c family protein
MGTRTALGSPRRKTICLLVVGLAALVPAAGAAEPAVPQDVLFLIGTPDAHAAEFGLTEAGEGYAAYLQRFAKPVVYTVGQGKASQWPYVHPAPLDFWAGGRVHTHTIRFAAAQDERRPLFLVLGLAGGSPSQRSDVVVAVGGKDLPGQTAPSADPRVCFQPRGPGQPQTMIFEIPAGRVVKGENTLSIRLERQSWIIYDYVALRRENRPLPLAPAPQPRNLLAEFRRGPMAGADEIVFAVRRLGDDPHWYANFGETLDHSRWRTYYDGARLCRLNLVTGKLAVLLDEPHGGIRDPAVHEDGRTIVFAYRKGGTQQYHLYTIRSDGSGLRQLTFGDYDDVEPAWLPDGGIIFVSARCRRCVNCHTTDVAVLHRCDADGRNVRALSSNNEHDNTPWPLPGGQILYTRWEYVDRNQMAFHHLWTANPDGTRQTVFFGNQRPGITMIDARPIPGSRKIVASFSPGHGVREHNGVLTVVDPGRGPDDQPSARPISPMANLRDPWAFSEEAFLAACGPEIVLIDGQGQAQVVYRLPDTDVRAGLECHEPRPLAVRTPERAVCSTVDWARDTGRVMLADVYRGRNMAGLRRGEIKRLLVLETLPKPINYTGGMEPMSYGGTFTLERILGTIPVEADGSAYAELPALRSLFFVALDENDLSLKRMQSFMTVMPGETTGCVGCHEPRTTAPPHQAGGLLAMRRPPSRIEPAAGVPEVIDYPRDVQPILDRHCVACHDEDKRQGGLSLSGDHGPIFSISYYTLTARSLVADGRNGMGDRPPRSIGSGASRLVKLMDGTHHGAKPSDLERRLVRLWIDSGAAYPGTYAALGTGMIGAFEIVDRSIRLDRSDLQWPEVQASVEALTRRCASCHGEQRPIPLTPSHLVGPGGWGPAFRGAPPWVDLAPNDVRRRWSRHLTYNLTRPEKSLLLLAPLAKAAGGLESCGKAVFADAADPDYQRILAAIHRAKERLGEITRFDMPGFRPRIDYVRRMQRYGILPAELPPGAKIDVYAAERAYWESLWHRPAAR